MNLLEKELQKATFWLNILNYLTLYTLIVKGEMPTYQFDWEKFYKNSVYNIGGFELSLYEIRNSILTDSQYSLYYTKQDLTFKKSDLRRKLKIETFGLITFGVFTPTM